MKMNEITKLFPEMSDIEMAMLKADIDKNGQRTPIWTYKGEIIDGRHRFMACEELGINPTYEKNKGKADEMVGFVVSLNLCRRHLKESQRAMIATTLANLGSGKSTKSGGVSQKTAAELMNVSDRSLRSARKVKEFGSSGLNAAVTAGDVAVSTAAILAKQPHTVQDAAVDAGDVTMAKAKAIGKAAEAAVYKYSLTVTTTKKGIYQAEGEYDTIKDLMVELVEAVEADDWKTINLVRQV